MILKKNVTNTYLNKIMSKQMYSEFAVAVDLIMNEYQTSNPVEISEYIYRDLGMCTTIHQVSDYLDVNRQDYEKESNKVKYYESITINRQLNN